MTDQGIYYLSTAFGAVGVAWAIVVAMYIIFKYRNN